MHRRKGDQRRAEGESLSVHRRKGDLCTAYHYGFEPSDDVAAKHILVGHDRTRDACLQCVYGTSSRL